jgi:PAS domain S-box-containing protein
VADGTADGIAPAAATSHAAPLPSGPLLDQLLEAATDAIWMRDPDGVFQVANDATCSIMGRTRDRIIGHSVAEIWGDEIAAQLAEQTRQIFASGVPQTVEEEMLHAGLGERRIYLSNKVPVYGPDRQPLGILGISRDITERKRNELALQESEARLALQLAEMNALYEAAPLGLAFFDREYRYLRINDVLAEINGVPASQHIGRSIREVLPANAPHVEPVIDRIFATGEAIGDFEVTGETHQQPGVMRHWLTGFYPVTGSSGDVEAVGAWVVEISERKAAEQREALLAREVDHRAKNLLAIVQSIVQLTKAGDADELKEGIIGRIQSLARAHSLLADTRWDGAQLGQIVREELAPYLGSHGAGTTVDGPPLLLRPVAAQGLAMVLHELATNAAKYGALSRPGGQLTVQWVRADGVLELCWEEQGGPAVEPPRSSGFGSRIIRATIEGQLHGRLQQEWRSKGLLCVIRIPAAEVGATVAPENFQP